MAIPSPRVRMIRDNPPAAAQTPGRNGIIGQSKPMLAFFSQLERIAPHFTTVLIHGETGTGKELVARALHDLSPAREGPLVTVNCSAVVEALFESELFGHVRGAFTDAKYDKAGLFELANGGTLLLDEIGDMPLGTQAKLLRVLQNRVITRVGSLASKKVEIRVIAATNKDLRAEAAAGRFRLDLYYRLSMVELELPPLRERPEDIPVLLRHFARQWSERFSKPFAGFHPDVVECLERHAWPGNVRELENAVGHACMVSSSPEVGMDALPAYLFEAQDAVKPGALPALPLPQRLSAGMLDVFDEYELHLVRQALEQAHHNQSRAARMLKTTRDRFRYRMKKFGLLPDGDGSVDSDTAT